MCQPVASPRPGRWYTPQITWYAVKSETCMCSLEMSPGVHIWLYWASSTFCCSPNVPDPKDSPSCFSCYKAKTNFFALLALSVPTFPWGTKWQEDRERKQSSGDSLCALGISVPPIRANVLPSKLLLSFPALPNCLGVGQARTERKPTKSRDFLYSLWLLGAPFPASWTKSRVFSSSSFPLRVVHSSGFGLPLSPGQEIPGEGKRNALLVLWYIEFWFSVDFSGTDRVE